MTTFTTRARTSTGLKPVDVRAGLVIAPGAFAVTAAGPGGT